MSVKECQQPAGWMSAAVSISDWVDT